MSNSWENKLYEEKSFTIMESAIDFIGNSNINISQKTINYFVNGGLFQLSKIFKILKLRGISCAKPDCKYILCGLACLNDIIIACEKQLLNSPWDLIWNEKVKFDKTKALGSFFFTFKSYVSEFLEYVFSNNEGLIYRIVSLITIKDKKSALAFLFIFNVVWPNLRSLIQQQITKEMLLNKTIQSIFSIAIDGDKNGLNYGAMILVLEAISNIDSHLFCDVIFSIVGGNKILLKTKDFFNVFIHYNFNQNNFQIKTDQKFLLKLEGSTKIYKVFAITRLFNIWSRFLKFGINPDKEYLSSCIMSTTTQLDLSDSNNIDFFNFHFYNILNIRSKLKKKNDMDFESEMADMIYKILYKYSDMTCWFKMWENGSLLKLSNSLIETTSVVIAFWKEFKSEDIPQVFDSLPIVRKLCENIDPSMILLVSVIRTFIDGKVIVKDIDIIIETLMKSCMINQNVLKEVFAMTIIHYLRSSSRDRFEVIKTVLTRVSKDCSSMIPELVLFIIISFAEGGFMKSIRLGKINENIKIISFISTLIKMVKPDTKEMVEIISALFCVFGWTITNKMIGRMFKNETDIFEYWLKFPLATDSFQNMYSKNCYIMASGLILKNSGKYSEKIYANIIKYGNLTFKNFTTFYGLDFMYKELFKIIEKEFKNVV